MDMEWLTTTQIENRAALGDMEAIEVSIEHWKQIISASKKEIASQNLAEIIYSSHCGICSRFFDNTVLTIRGCDKCPVSRKFGMCDAGDVENVWCKMEQIFNCVFKDGCGDDTFRTFKKYARAMLHQLKQIKLDYERMDEFTKTYGVCIHGYLLT